MDLGDEPPAGMMSMLGLAAVTSASRVTTGHDAVVWRVVSGGRPVAVRLLPKGRDPRPELDALELAARRGLPVPRVLATGVHQGRAVLAMTWCPGRPIGELLLAGDDARHLGELFGKAHAAVHTPAPDGSVLCHLDFQPFNVLLAGTEVSGIVDWPNARLGDPREDIATTRVVLAFAPALSAEIAAFVDVFAAAWSDGYASVRRMPSDAELGPFLRAAAQRQWRDWSARAELGQTSPAIAHAARTIAERVW